MMTRQEMDKLSRLNKRLIHLQERINTSPMRLSYDEAEASALTWAITTIEKYFSERTEDGKQ